MSSTEKNIAVQPYLFFDGRCEEALEFYKTALGAQVLMVVRYNESPDPAHNPPGSENKIMHARFSVAGSIVMGSDGHCAGKPQFEGFALSLTVHSGEDAARYFNALADGGKISMPLAKTFFSPSFGMVADKFGVVWMVLVHAEM